MESGTTPLPLSANGGLSDNRSSETPRGYAIAAHGKRTARYIMFLFAVPAGPERGVKHFWHRWS